jgi:hypothetical protein
MSARADRVAAARLAVDTAAPRLGPERLVAVGRADRRAGATA